MASLGLSELTHCPGRFGCDFKNSNYVLLIGILYDNALRWMPQNITDDKSTLVQVIAWCRQATSHYLSQCWPKSLSPYNVTWPQWINPLAPGRGGSQFKTMNFKLVIQDNSFGAHCEIALMWMPQDLTNQWEVNMASGNGLVPSSNKPLPDLCCHVVSQIHNG